MILIGCFCESILMIAVTFAPSIPLLFLGIAGVAVSHGIFQPMLPTMVSLHTHKDFQGFILGIYSSCGSLARIFGPMIAGILYDTYWRLPAFVAGGLLFISFVLLIFLPEPNASQNFIPLSQEEPTEQEQ